MLCSQLTPNRTTYSDASVQTSFTETKITFKTNVTNWIHCNCLCSIIRPNNGDWRKTFLFLTLQI